MLRRATRLGVSVLAENQDTTARSLAARGVNRFADMPWTATDDGAVLLNRAAAWLDCDIGTEHEAGDHLLVPLRVRAMVGDPSHPPLVFHASTSRGLFAEPGEVA